MSDLTFRPATREDVAYLAPRLRAWDVRELRGALGAVPVEEALEQSVAISSWSQVALDDGEPVWIVGCGTAVREYGSPWLLGTEAYARRRKAFLFHTRRFAEQMASEHAVLANYVAADNRRSQTWLKWLGFDVRPERVRLQPGGIPFNLFVRFSNV
jgi:hypothetical protein